MKKYIITENYTDYDGYILFNLETPLYLIYSYLSKKSKLHNFTSLHTHKDYICPATHQFCIYIHIFSLPF